MRKKFFEKCDKTDNPWSRKRQFESEFVLISNSGKLTDVLEPETVVLTICCNCKSYLCMGTLDEYNYNEPVLMAGKNFLTYSTSGNIPLKIQECLSAIRQANNSQLWQFNFLHETYSPSSSAKPANRLLSP